MRIREQLLIGLLVATAAYAAWMTHSANRLRTDLTTLQASNARLQENHLQMKEHFIQLALNPGTKDDAFRKLLAVLDAEGGTDIITSSDPGTTPVNKAPIVPTT